MLTDYSSINRYSIVDCGSIGNFSSIGPNCLIGAGKHAIKYISTSQRVYGKNNILGISTPFEAFDSPPIIGHDVWIGNNVTVMQGVKIGNGAVIGSGAVVTKDIPPYTICGGVPAKFIKYRFSQEHIEYLQQLDLWSNYKDNIAIIRDLIYLETDE